MTQDLSTITPDEELDLSGVGLQPFEDDLLIVDAGIEDDDNGRRWFIHCEPQNEVEAAEQLPNGVVREGGYLTVNADSYPREKAQQMEQIALRTLKRVFKAALGTDHGAIADLKGELIHARVDEDDRGFARMRGIRAVS